MFSEYDIQYIKTYLIEYFPKNDRDKFWFIGSGAKREMLNFPDYYNNILNNYPDYIPSLYEQTIDKDITRTFPDEKFFQLFLKLLQNRP